jgi:hypothetical protein
VGKALIIINTEDCLLNENGMDCEEKNDVCVIVPHEPTTTLDIVTVVTIKTQIVGGKT